MLIFGEISLSEEQKANYLFESGSVVTWEQAFRNLWLNPGANKLAPLPGTRLNIIPGKNDKDSKDKEFFTRLEVPRELLTDRGAQFTLNLL